MSRATIRAPLATRASRTARAIARSAARACAATACVGAGASLGALAGAVLGARHRRGVVRGAVRGALAGARALLDAIGDENDDDAAARAEYVVLTDAEGRARVMQLSIPRATGFGDVVRALLEIESTYEALEAMGRARGAAVGVVKRLPRREYVGDGTTAACAVCLDAFAEGQTVKRASSTCAHEFHDACIDAWLARRDCCPMCRTRAAAPTGVVDFEIN